MSYEKAAAQCQADGGDLFKMDTKLKFEILTEYLGRLNLNTKTTELFLKRHRCIM